MTTAVTPKGEQTRQHILDIAIGLFISKGYESTTMREIAAAARCSLGLAYRYFDSKEDLVMALYLQTARQFAAQVGAFEPASMAEQFERAMLAKLALLVPYREAIGALFSASMNPNSKVAVLGEGTADIRHTVRGLYQTLLEQATDAPRQSQLEQLATVLYGAHLAVILFWLYDRTPEYRATRELISFARDMLGMLRPLLRLPPVASALSRLAGSIGGMFGAM
jgi:AcrR family transcriptional regulator